MSPSPVCQMALPRNQKLPNIVCSQVIHTDPPFFRRASWRIKKTRPEQQAKTRYYRLINSAIAFTLYLTTAELTSPPSGAGPSPSRKRPSLCRICLRGVLKLILTMKQTTHPIKTHQGPAIDAQLGGSQPRRFESTHASWPGSS